MVKPSSMGIFPANVAEANLLLLVSGETITHGVFMLEDGQSMVSWDGALMWFEFTPFSPLPSHAIFRCKCQLSSPRFAVGQ
jgi:hypothetical protein